MACLLLIPGAGSYWFPSQAQPCDVSANRKKAWKLGKKKTKFRDHSSRSCASLPVAPLFFGSDSDRLIPAKNEDMFIICSRSLFLLLGMRRIRCMCKHAVRLGVLIFLSFKPCLIKGKHDKQPPEWDAVHWKRCYWSILWIKGLWKSQIFCVHVKTVPLTWSNQASALTGIGGTWMQSPRNSYFFKCVFHQKRTMLLLPLNLSCGCYYTHYLLSKARKYKKKKEM